MRADPRDCQHMLAVDDATHIVYCTQCMWWWHLDVETPLNQDNEPTSEHNQWSEDNE